MKRTRFTILELIIVVGIIAVLSTFLIPLFKNTQSKALKDVTFQEMKKIQRAFIRLNDDCLLTGSALEECEKYGLWVLFQREHPVLTGKNLQNYDPERGKGWLGKYMVSEGVVRIDPTLDGQKEGTGAGSVVIPVVKDSYGGYYRVLIPDGERKVKVVLVCAGPDGVLDTTSFSKDSDGDITAVGDDVVMRLLPSE